MVKKIFWLCILIGLLASGAYAQDIVGDWQGTPKGVRGPRLILRIAKNENGDWNARVFSIDQGDWGTGIPVTSMSLLGSDLKFSIWSL